MSTESNDLTEYTYTPQVTGGYQSPMTAAEQREARRLQRVEEDARRARVDALFIEHDLGDGVVMRDAVGNYFELTMMRSDSRHTPAQRRHDAWWSCFGSEEGWQVGWECTHASRRARGRYDCPRPECRGGPVLPLTHAA